MLNLFFFKMRPSGDIILKVFSNILPYFRGQKPIIYAKLYCFHHGAITGRKCKPVLQIQNFSMRIQIHIFCDDADPDPGPPPPALFGSESGARG